MDEATVEKLKILSDLAKSIPCNAGENFIYFGLWPNFTQGTVEYGLDYKCEMGERDFHTLDEAIAIVQKIKDRIENRIERGRW